MWNPRVHHLIHNSPPLLPILNKINKVHVPKLISLKSILILSSHLRLGLPSGLAPPPCLPTKTLYAPLLAIIRATWPTYPIFLHLFDHPNNICNTHRSRSSLLCSPHQSSVTSSLLGPNIFLSTLFSNSLRTKMRTRFKHQTIRKPLMAH